MSDNNARELNIHTICMSDKVFKLFSAFIQEECGIKMPPAKKTMLEGRLRKRLRNLGMKSFNEYCDYLFSPEGMNAEAAPMIDAVTTNKTDFFREPDHFEYLMREALPELIRIKSPNGRGGLRFWSAACSTGEEPYSIAMVLSEFCENQPGLLYTILATDISFDVLTRASRGIYEHDRIEPVPMALRKKYLLKSKDRTKTLVRVVPELVERIEFRRLNLMQEDYELRKPMDVIFCRNVLIYFDKPTQETIVNHLSRHLMAGGYLIVGHSETLHSFDVPLLYAVRGAANIYRRL